jgi:hypothetical protein
MDSVNRRILDEANLRGHLLKVEKEASGRYLSESRDAMMKMSLLNDRVPNQANIS